MTKTHYVNEFGEVSCGFKNVLDTTEYESQVTCINCLTKMEESFELKE